MGNLLFNPNGRINKGPFWQGVIVLTVLSVLMSVLSAYVSPFVSYLGIFLIYPYLCVYGKRLHDAGLTAWIFLAFLVGSLIVSFILSAILTPILAPGVTELQAEMMENAFSGGGNPADVMEMAKEVTQAALPASIATGILSNLIVGFIAAMLKDTYHNVSSFVEF